MMGHERVGFPSFDQSHKFFLAVNNSVIVGVQTLVCAYAKHWTPSQEN
jgi:hypothetical protein